MGDISCPILPHSGCSEQVALGELKREAISKADWIRSVSDEELVLYLASFIFGWDALNDDENQLNQDVYCQCCRGCIWK